MDNGQLNQECLNHNLIVYFNKSNPELLKALEDNPYAGTWSSGGGLNTARSGSTGAGIQTAALMAGGYGGSPAARLTTVESLDGTNWTEVNDANDTTYFNAGAGASNSSGIEFGGNPGPGVGSEAFASPI